MASDLVLAGCTGKERFTSYGAADRVQKRRSRNKDFRKHAVYRCKVCQGYHIGSGGKTSDRPIKAMRRFMARYENREA